MRIHVHFDFVQTISQPLPERRQEEKIVARKIVLSLHAVCCVRMYLCSIPLGQIIVKSQQHFRQMGSLNAGKNNLISSVELLNRFVCISMTLKLLTVTMHANESNGITLDRHGARYKHGARKKTHPHR